MSTEIKEIVLSKKQLLNYLKKARTLLTPRENWTQKYYARDHSKKMVEPETKAAVCWCAVGALRKVSGNWVKASLCAMAMRSTKMYTMTNFNDYSTHKQVLAQFDKVIGALENG